MIINRVTFINIIRGLSHCRHCVLHVSSHLMLKTIPKGEYLFINSHFTKEELSNMPEHTLIKG